jgi:hypothetical protein
MHTHRYEEYVEGQEEEDVDDVYQEEPIEHQISWYLMAHDSQNLLHVMLN